jgi:hypothetical protein
MPSTRDAPGLVIAGDGVDIDASGRLSVKKPHASGTWTAKLINGPGGDGIVVESLGCTYTKSGPLLYANFDIKVTRLNSTKEESYVMLEGLPFMTKIGSRYCGTLSVGLFSGLGSGILGISGSVRGRSFSCDLWCVSSARGEQIPLQRSHLKVGSRLQGTIVCEVLD